MVIEQLDRTGPSQTPARDNDRDSLVGLYFRDASRYQILTEDQEKRLSRRLSLCFRVIQRELALPADTPHTFREIVGSLGDAGALSTRCRRAYHLSLHCRRTLIQSNLRLAVHIARRFGQHGIPMPDLIQDANVGLIKAAERFDPSKGFRFSTYAYWWISEEVKRCLQRGVRVVHTPEGVVDEIRELQRVSLRLNRALGREPSQAELAREMEASPSRIGELRALASREVSTDAPLIDDSSITLGDSLAGSSRMTPEHPMAERDQRRALRAMLAELTEREQDILSRRFGLDLPAPETLQVISDNLGISRERVRQIEKGALKKLQSRFVRLDEVYGV